MMKEYASRLDFERAIELREQVAKLEKRLNALKNQKNGQNRLIRPIYEKTKLLSKTQRKTI